MLTATLSTPVSPSTHTLRLRGSGPSKMKPSRGNQCQAGPASCIRISALAVSWFLRLKRAGGEHALSNGMTAMVESRMGAVAWGLWPTLRFPSPLIKPDVPISGIRLSGWLHREARDVAARGKRWRHRTPSSR